ncbi:MAG: response regulator transcription factor [Ardenticatenia bacterium]|nr:response regulator transcription factor [Ardenticatenia bacterium]
MRVLVVDDDQPSVKMTAFLLREEGYDVLTADNGREALRIVEEEPIDLVILDVMMPHLDGYEVCRRIRQLSDAAIIFLSAKGETSDRVHGLQLGADDYLTKPFEPAELLARVQAVLRRTTRQRDMEANQRICIDQIELDPVANRLVRPDGKVVELTPIETRLLHALMRNAGRTLTHDMLLDAGWGENYIGSSNQVAVYMRRLRAKLEPDPNNPVYLQTVRGIGYRFEAP